MSSKHTPGPWSPIEYDDGTWAVDNGHGYLVAVLQNVGRSVGSSTTEADARLIAAAPEMLEALKDLIGWVPGGVHFHTDAPQKAVERASAAIAKATGETQCAS